MVAAPQTVILCVEDLLSPGPSRPPRQTRLARLLPVQDTQRRPMPASRLDRRGCHFGAHHSGKTRGRHTPTLATTQAMQSTLRQVSHTYRIVAEALGQPQGPCHAPRSPKLAAECHQVYLGQGPFPLEVSGLLTLFSKFFATFPHGTCLLSVFRLYLGLGGIHLPSLHYTLKQCDSVNSPGTRRFTQP